MSSYTNAVRRFVASLAIAGGVFFGGSAVAHADPVGFFDQWVGHDRSIQLFHDGTGKLVLGDGALNTDSWALTWRKNPSDSVTITLKSLIGRSGPGMGNVGDQYIATIQPDRSGLQTFGMHRINPPGKAYTFCTLPELRIDPQCGG